MSVGLSVRTVPGKIVKYFPGIVVCTQGEVTDFILIKFFEKMKGENKGEIIYQKVSITMGLKLRSYSNWAIELRSAKISYKGHYIKCMLCLHLHVYLHFDNHFIF